MRTAFCAGAVALALTTGLQAEPPNQSPRPELRTGSTDTVGRAATPGLLQSLRPATRPPEPAAVVTVAAANSRFDAWLRAFKPRAREAGIRTDVIDRTVAGAQYLPDVIARDRNQAEFSKPIWEYLDGAVSNARLSNGRAALDRYQRTLSAIEDRYGVDKEVVVAVWGLESAYGSYRGSTNTVDALATLSFEGRRGAFFEEQLIAALQIIQDGDVTADGMAGSWAGAMGHTQFMPTSYLTYAVDFTGDGRRDIWSDDPSDALASTAAYLARKGWVKNQPWGVEVVLPAGFDYALADREIIKTPRAWARLGVRGTNGQAVPNYGRGAILLPAGGRGAAFMIFENFNVIERYNAADAYVIGVGHLSDRLKGGPPIRASWPRGDRTLSFKEKKELQTRLTAAGFSTDGVDGRVGPKTIDAVRDYQVATGLVPDGYPSLDLLQKLR
jgi:membrane-bound lytic murein transglycosylase B